MRRKKERVRLYRLKLARRCVVVLLLFICAFFCISLLKSPQIESDADSVSSFTSQKDAVLSVVPHEMSQEESVQEKLKLLEKEFPSGIIAELKSRMGLQTGLSQRTFHVTIPLMATLIAIVITEPRKSFFLNMII